MKKPLLIIVLILPILCLSQVGIGTTTPNASAALEIESTTSGILIPRLTQVQRDAIATPANGLLIYQTDNTAGFYYYDGGTWQPFAGAADNDWIIAGNNMYNANSDNVGIGTTNPTTKLHIENTSSATTILNQDFEAALTPLTTSGDANWLLQGISVNGGVQAAESGNIADSQESILQYSATIPAAGATLNFSYEVSSESGFDFLEFLVDGTVIDSWSGTVPWTNYSYNFTGVGTPTIQWRYFKDTSSSIGDDVARIDNITLISSGDAAIRIVDGSQSDGKVLTSDANGNGRWTTLSSNQVSNLPEMANVYGMRTPICNDVVVGDSNTFSVNIQGVPTTVTWTILNRKTVIGQTTTIMGVDVLRAPFYPSQLQVQFDFLPDLPFEPDSIFFSGNNSIVPFPISEDLNSFRYDYVTKSINSITLNIGRTDRLGDTTSDCWAGIFAFDMLLVRN